MAKNQPKTIKPFMSIEDVAAFSGLSQSYIRKGCKEGRIVHIRSGIKYNINTAAFCDQHGIPYEIVRL